MVGQPCTRYQRAAALLYGGSKSQEPSHCPAMEVFFSFMELEGEMTSRERRGCRGGDKEKQQAIEASKKVDEISRTERRVENKQCKGPEQQSETLVGH